MTGIDARARLHSLKTEDPEFWVELTQEESAIHKPPPQDVCQPEDEQYEADEEAGYMDDSNVPVAVLADVMIHSSPDDHTLRAGWSHHKEGGLMNIHRAEAFEDNRIKAKKRKARSNEDQLGCGKQVRLASTHYSSTHFEQH